MRYYLSRASAPARCSTLLLGWTPNPGTSFFIGYSYDATVSGFSPFTGQPLEGFRRDARNFFIKMSYLIRRSL